MESPKHSAIGQFGHRNNLLARYIERPSKPAIRLKAGQPPLNPTKTWDIESQVGEKATAVTRRQYIFEIG